MTNSTRTPIQPGTVHHVTIQKLVFEGWGLTAINRFRVLVQGGLPGDVVNAVITHRKRRYAKAKITQFIEKSSMRTENHCTHFPDCGGCQLIDVDYPTQLNLKHHTFIETLQKLYSGPQDITALVRDILPSRSPHFYRNKMDFAFGQVTHPDGSSSLSIGLKKRGEFDKIVPLSSCWLQDPVSNRILTESVQFFNAKNVDAWNYHTHSGLMRHLILRHSKTTQNFLITVVVSESVQPLITEYAEMIQNAFPNVTSVLMSVQSTQSDTSSGGILTPIFGTGSLQESIGPLTYRVSASSFFQTNTLQTQRLYDTIVDYASDPSPKLVLDLYCGTGTIGLYMAAHAQSVIGVEEHPAAIQDAMRNAKDNGISNISFHEGRVKNILKFCDWKPDVVIMDPPRSGMVPKALARIMALNAPTLVYVSCNPATLARDLSTLTSGGYVIDPIQPVDMFPNTFHVESVTRLTRSA